MESTKENIGFAELSPDMPTATRGSSQDNPADEVRVCLQGPNVQVLQESPSKRRKASKSFLLSIF